MKFFTMGTVETEGSFRLWQDVTLRAVALVMSVMFLVGSGEAVANDLLYVKDSKEYYEGSDGKILTVDIPETLTFLRQDGRKTYYRTKDGKEIATERYGGLLPATIPDYDWWYGCSPTSAGMMMGFYDLHGYNGQSYTNLVPGGTAESSSHGTSAPLANAAIASSTYIADYWVGYGQSGNDPCPRCHADNSLAGFMETGKDSAGNTDGESRFTYFTSNSPFTAANVESWELQYKSGMYGIGEWVRNAGYNYTSLYNQRIYGADGVSAGFTFQDFKAEIDAGRPVIIHIEGHTMLGVGYSGTSTIYVNDTWNAGPHTMTWGGSYDGRAHNMVTCLTLTGGTSASKSYLLWTK